MLQTLLLFAAGAWMEDGAQLEAEVGVRLAVVGLPDHGCSARNGNADPVNSCIFYHILKMNDSFIIIPVSYTHLTLPTILLV